MSFAPLPSVFDRSTRKSLASSIQPRLRWIHHGALSGALALSALSPFALGQWNSNPTLAYANDGDPFVFLPIAGGVISIDREFLASRLDSKGQATEPSTVIGSSWGGGGSGGSAIAVELVGCSLGPDRFALAYRLDPEDEFGETIRVGMFRFQDGEYVREFEPVSIGEGDRLSIAPNVQSDGSIDGVLVAWRDNYSFPIQPAGSIHVHGIFQQGVRNNGTPVWTGTHALKGAEIGGGPFDDEIHDAPTIVSDGAGLAIVTYRARSTGLNDLGEPDDYRFHRSAKLDENGDLMWDVELPGQIGDSPGTCVVSRDGSGGALYGFANDESADRTNLVVARVDASGSAESRVFWTSTPASPKLRMLAAVESGHDSIVIAYRDLSGIRSICFADDPGLPAIWTTFLHGATADNSEEAAGVRGPDYAAFAWTAGSRVVVKGLDVVNGDEVYDTGVEVQMNGKSPECPGSAPHRPRIVPTAIACGFFDRGFVVGWEDEDLWDTPRFLAERVNDGGFLAPPCPGGFFVYGGGLPGGAGEPTLTGSGNPIAGSLVTLQLEHAAPFSPAILLLGFNSTALPFLGGMLHVAPPLTSVTLPLGAQGSLALPLPLPDVPGLGGLNVYFQAAILDASAPQGAALTKGLRMEIG